MGDIEGKIEYLDNITLMPKNTGLNTRSKKEILDKLLVDYVIASIATYAIYSSFDLIKTFLSSLDKKYNINSLLTSKDKELVLNICNRKISLSNLEELSYKFESSNLCMWFLGLSSELYYDKKCSVKKINEVLLFTLNYEELMKISSLRKSDELIEYYSKIAKYIYSDSEIDFVSAKVISIQEETIKYIVLYNFNRDGVKLIYNNGDLKFEFDLPDQLLLEKVGANTKELLALVGTRSNIRIIMSELSGVKVHEDIKRFMNMGFTVHSVDYMNSKYIDKRLLKVVMSRNSLKLNVYYINISNHLIRYDSKVVENSVDSNIIFSIKML